MYFYIVFFCPVCASIMRGRTVNRETGRIGAGERRRRGEKRGKGER
jgi:hypothetical protein